MTPYNWTEPDWRPLERAVRVLNLRPSTLDDWMWMHEDPIGVHHYKNRYTRQYISLTMDGSVCGGLFVSKSNVSNTVERAR